MFASTTTFVLAVLCVLAVPMVTTALPEEEHKPMNLTVVKLASKEIEVSWRGDTKNVEKYLLSYKGPLEWGTYEVSPSVTKYTIEKLEPGTVYYIQIAIIDQIGKKLQSETISVKTLIDQKPMRTWVEIYNATAIAVSWYPFKSWKKYKVFYASVNEGDNPISVDHKGRWGERLIAGLKPGQNYSVSVARYSDKGEEETKSLPKYISTPSVKSSPPIKGVALLQPNPPVLHVSWTEPKGYDEITEYRIDWRQKGDDVFKQVTVSSCHTGFTTPFLDWDTFYEFKVMVTDKDGVGPMSNASMKTPSRVENARNCSRNTEKETDGVVYKGVGISDDITMTSSTTPPNKTAYTTAMPDTYQCLDQGVAGFTCKQFVKGPMKKKKMCKKYFHDCCETCSKICKKERPVRLRKGVKTCQDMVTEYGKQVACTLFTFECCKTCGRT